MSESANATDQSEFKADVPATVADNDAAAPTSSDDKPTPKSAEATPKPRSKPAPQASATAPDINERAYAQYQVLAQAVLESGENATRSAQAAANASRDLKQASNAVMEMGQSVHKRNQIMLAVAGGVMLVGLIFFMIMGVRMISRINQLDAMLLAVGKRAVELNAGLESLDSVQQSMQALVGKQAELRTAQAQLETRIESSLKQSESYAQKVPQETAKQVAASSNALAKQVQDINNRLQAQNGAVQSLGKEISSLKTATSNVDKLNRDVEALITLQRERYLEALQKTNQGQQRERAVQFPRRDAKAPELNLRPQ